MGTGRNTQRWFRRWRDRGVWARLLDSVTDDPDFEWLMIDTSYIKVHPPRCRGLWRNPGHGPH